MKAHTLQQFWESLKYCFLQYPLDESGSITEALDLILKKLEKQNFACSFILDLDRSDGPVENISYYLT